jgi:HK97 family phage prohead protease
MGDSPPRENVFRAAYLPGAASVIDRAADGGPERILTGHFAVFNRWTEINSVFEGNFMERIAPGTFKKTFQEPDGIRVLFQHGRDPQVGDKPLGTIESLSEDRKGAAYEVNMLDTSYNRDLIPGLAAGVYGASFRFRVLREDLVMEPEASEDNPRALPERTIKEAAVSEFGPVTFPAYADATAGLRSITDDMILSMYAAQEPDRFARLISSVRALDTIDATISPVKGADEIVTPDTRRMAENRPLVIVRNPNRER